MRYALSSMFAQQERFADGAVFARFAADAGFDAIEVSHSTPPAKADSIVAAGILPVTVVHSPAPLCDAHDGRTNADLNLAATGEKERLAAVEAALSSLRWASSVGATRLVVHPGHVESGSVAALQRELGALVTAGRGSTAQAGKLRAMLGRSRALAAPVHLDAAILSIRQLTAEADAVGIMIGLENRVAYHEIPLPDEVALLMHETGAGYWHDVGHAEVLARLGLVNAEAWGQVANGHVLGAHVHDVDALADHRAPGNGDVDFAGLVPLLGHLEEVTFEIDQRQPDDLVRAARGLCEAAGLR